MKNQKNSHFILKAILLCLCSCMYFIEGSFYIIFTSPVDSGFTPDPIGDVIIVLALCVFKICSVILFMYVLKKLNEKGIGINIYIILITTLCTYLYILTISLNHSNIELLRIFIPIIVNVSIIILLGIRLVKDLINLKK